MLPRAKKRFGQHFLTDRHYIARIISAISPQPDDVLVEIGPGPGAITEPLLGHLKHLHAVEVDRDLASALRVQFAEDKLTLHEADVLAFDFSVLPFRASWRISRKPPWPLPISFGTSGS